MEREDTQLTIGINRLDAIRQRPGDRRLSFHPYLWRREHDEARFKE
jgi:hypothetical protein